MLYPNRTGAIFRYLLPSCTWKVQTTKNEIFLTFDDGPVPEVTEWVLNLLSFYGIKATFFCVGDNIRKYTSVFKKIVAQNHAIGNHTFNHLKGWKTSDQDYFFNVKMWENIVDDLNIVRYNKPVFRPPYGQISLSQAKTLKNSYEIVMWDIITGDFDKSLNKENCLRKCTTMTRPGSIIVFHDSLKAKDNLQYILPEYIRIMLEKGFTFATW